VGTRPLGPANPFSPAPPPPSVSSSNCPACGAPAPVGARFCSYCGGAIPATSPPGAPAPLTPPPPPPLPSAYGYTFGAPAPPKPRRSKWLVLAVIIVVVILVVGVVAVLLVPAGPAVQVQGINVWALDNVCGLNANPIGYNGFNGSSGASQAIELQMPNYNATPCTIHAITTNTSGFSFTGVTVPVTIPGNGTLNLTLTVVSPSGTFNGVLNMDLA
jgi:hypothetical protein